MKVAPLLKDANFGEDVAENDRMLANYFVETSTFFDVVNDRFDIILGDKGSGKTALLTYLSRKDAPIPELDDVDRIVAFNPVGNVIFCQLLENGSRTEHAFRQLWNTYFVALLGNHLLVQYRDEIDLGKLKSRLRDANLLTRENAASTAWAAAAQRCFGQLEFEGEASTLLPIPAKGRLRLKRDVQSNRVDLEEVLRLELDALRLLERRAWLLVDRIDEAFPSNRELEQLALRSLLRTIVDICPGDETLRIKCCLRSDVSARITERKGFVNATHLRRTKLKWDRERLISLVARRIAATEFAPQLSIGAAQLRTLKGRLSICELVLPAKVGDEELFAWIERRTVDATREPTPRNLITLLGEARELQLAEYDRDDPEYRHGESLISADALKMAAVALSEKRLEDTILAEFNHLTPAIEALRDQPAHMTISELAQAMGIDVTRARTVMQDLKYCGVVAVEGDILSVPLLYRPALKSHIERGSAGMTDAERSFLEGRARKAIRELTSEIRQQVTMTELDEGQRAHVIEYVLDNYPTVLVEVQTPSTEVELLTIAMTLKRASREEQRQAASNRESPAAPSAYELQALVYPLVERITDGASIAVSEELPRQVLDAMEQRAVIGGEENLSVVARLADGDELEVGRLVIAKDIPGSTLDEQDRAMAVHSCVVALREQVSELANLVASENARAHRDGRDRPLDATEVCLRPRGPAVVAEAVGILRERDDVTYRMEVTSGETAIRLRIIRRS